MVIINRPKPFYGREGLDWIVGPEYSLGVFSTSRFAPAALNSVELVVRIKQTGAQAHRRNPSKNGGEDKKRGGPN